MWRHREQLRITAIVKATFSLPVSGRMRRINPQAIRRTDDYLSGLPSLAGAAETAPRLNEAGAVVVGHAYCPDKANRRSVRFTIVRGDKLLVDKTLYVYGDRVKGGAPKPFKRMRIGWERALGGLEFSKNPIGVGLDSDSTRRPNIIDPQNPKRGVGGYGPVPARFPRRRQKRGDLSLDVIENGLADYSEEFDWSFFQAAPKDQRLSFIKGGEWLMLEGMHPLHARIRTRLPRAFAYVRAYALSDVGAPDMVELRADTLHIEPNEDRCSIIWRGSFPISSEADAAQLVLAGAVQVSGEQLVWPDSLQELEHMASPAARAVEAEAAPPTIKEQPYQPELQPTAVSPGHTAELPAGAGVAQSGILPPPVDRTVQEAGLQSPMPPTPGDGYRAAVVLPRIPAPPSNPGLVSPWEPSPPSSEARQPQADTVVEPLVRQHGKAPLARPQDELTQPGYASPYIKPPTERYGYGQEQDPSSTYHLEPPAWPPSAIPPQARPREPQPGDTIRIPDEPPEPPEPDHPLETTDVMEDADDEDDGEDDGLVKPQDAAELDWQELDEE